MTTAGIRRPCLFCGVSVDPLVIDTTAEAGTVILRCPECGGENTCQMIVLEGDMRGEKALSMLPAPAEEQETAPDKDPRDEWDDESSCGIEVAT